MIIVDNHYHICNFIINDFKMILIITIIINLYILIVRPQNSSIYLLYLQLIHFFIYQPTIKYCSENISFVLLNLFSRLFH